MGEPAVTGWGKKLKNRDSIREKRVAQDLVAMLTELLHWRSCYNPNCKRCLPINGGATEAERMFGARKKDLSADEARQYQRAASRRFKARARAARPSDSLAREELDPQQ